MVELQAKAPVQRTYAVGDIHGRFDLFRQVMNAIARNQATRSSVATQIILLGNIIDRGPDAARMVRGCMHLTELTPDFLVLKGNHEDMMVEALGGSLTVYSHWLHYGGRETLRSFGVDPTVVAGGATMDNLAIAAKAVGNEVLDWLEHLPLHHNQGTHLFVHAGIRPGVEIGEQDPDDLLWIKDEFLNSTVSHGLTVVHGHSASDAPVFVHNRIGIDTGAYRTNRLTALGIEDGDSWVLDTRSSPDSMLNEAAREVGFDRDDGVQMVPSPIPAHAVIFGDQRLDADLAAILDDYGPVARSASEKSGSDPAATSMTAPLIEHGPIPSNRSRSYADPVVRNGAVPKIARAAPTRRSPTARAPLRDLMISRRAYATLSGSLLIALLGSTAIFFADRPTVQRPEPIGRVTMPPQVAKTLNSSQDEDTPNDGSSRASVKVAPERRLAAVAISDKADDALPRAVKEPRQRSSRSQTAQGLPGYETAPVLEHLGAGSNNVVRPTQLSLAPAGPGLVAVGGNTDAMASDASAVAEDQSKAPETVQARRASIAAIRSLRRQ